MLFRSKSLAELRTIVDMTKRLIGKAGEVEGLSVDFSGTHSQPDDVGTSASPSLIFGTEATANEIKALKKKMDPNNRFRFHPFAKLV